METWPSLFQLRVPMLSKIARLTDPIMERNNKQGDRLHAMDWNRIGVNRSIFDWKKFRLIVGPTGPSIFERRLYEITL